MLPQDNFSDKASPPRLLVDAMLGKLARWLRLMGYDAAYWNTGSDDALIRQARAEGRLILTRDHQLAGRRGVKALLITTESLDEQIAEVRAALGADPGPFSRCAECNGILVEVSRAEVRERVPPYVWHTQPVFHRCADCGRIYWKGSHWPGMEARLEGGRGHPAGGDERGAGGA